MGKRPSSHGGSCAGVLLAVGYALKMSGELREGALNVASALDDHQRALDEVKVRNARIWRDGGAEGDLSEEDWQIWDCCQGRIDAMVETCRNLGYEASRDQSGLWRVVFGCHR